MKKIAFIFILCLIFIVTLPSTLRADFVLSDGSLVKGSGPEVYFMENGMRRWVIDISIFNGLNFDFATLKLVSEDVLTSYPKGLDITHAKWHPNGMLVRKHDGKKVFLIQNGTRKWIPDERTFNNLGLSWNNIFEIPEKRLLNIRDSGIMMQGERVVHPGTVITETPGEVIQDYTVKVGFDSTPLTNNKNNVIFETYLEGTDRAWRVVRGNLRMLRLPKKTGIYNFFVRSKFVNGAASLIAQKYSFNVQISPYFGKVGIYGNGARLSNPDLEHVIVTNIGRDTISLAGWTIEDEKNGLTYAIPSAYEIPAHARFEFIDSIVLPPRGKVIMYSGRSPLGYNFRLNMCTGHLNTNTKAHLPRSCPRVESYVEETEYLGDYCNGIIARTPTCGEPDYNNTLLSNECRNYLRNNFGYAQCVVQNRSDNNFFSNQWRVYLKAQKDIWHDKRGSIVLKDAGGLVVSRYSY